ncbi:hypothetical protein EVAR_59367_1 [Eumeta japonica]|uniref:Uncharacterized protein n=1 Tax=Eumeta variegata TaxID=151549 RepID=A0A4C1ZYM6_EUMVA|nr:hypothetical protein EVAR_59367_1 [Eumeta japonica]
MNNDGLGPPLARYFPERITETADRKRYSKVTAGDAQRERQKATPATDRHDQRDEARTLRWGGSASVLALRCCIPI